MHGRRADLFAAATIGAGLLLIARHAKFSAGAALDDETGHFLICRDAWHDPTLLLSLWGRVVNSLIYFLPAALGWGGVQVASAGMVAATAWVSYRLASRLGVRLPHLVPAFFLLQPWVLANGHVCRTEIPFTLLLTLGLYCYAADRPRLAAALVGCLPLVRHEGMAVAGLWAFLTLCERSLLTTALVALPSILYNLAYFAGTGTPAFLIFLRPKPTEEFGSGGWMHFLDPFLRLTGPALAFAAVGLPAMFRSYNRSLVVVLPLTHLVTHVVIYRFGLFASGGYVEFLLPTAPAIAVVAAEGVAALFAELAASPLRIVAAARRLDGRVLAWAGLAAVLAFLAVYARGVATYRTRHTPDEAAGLEAARWVEENGYKAGRIETTYVWLYHVLRLPLPLADGDPERLWSKPPNLDDLPPNTLVLSHTNYDRMFGVFPRSALDRADGEWERLAVFGPDRIIVAYRKKDRPPVGRPEQGLP